MSNPDSVSASSSHSSGSGGPSYLKWSQSLTCLLDSPDGRDLFEEYLRGEGDQCVEQLQFLWAVAGLKVMQSTEDKIQKMIQIIYTTYIPILFGVSDSTRAALEENIKVPNINIFDKALSEVTEHMKESLYPNFLKSDNYLKAVASYYEEPEIQGKLQLPENAESISISTSDNPQIQHTNIILGQNDQSGPPDPTINQLPDPDISEIHDLQTVHEEEEMVSFNKPQPGPVRKLTKELLLSSQIDRAATNTKKFIGGVPLNPYHAHVNYNSYNPVSRQDSETQSISTEESLDLRSRSRHPASHHRTRPHISTRRPVIPIQNHDSLQPVGRPGPPQTQQNPKPESALAEKDPKAFAEKLIEKLKKVFEERNPGAHDIVQAALKLQQGIEEPEQDILDKHVSRVWADKTPTSCSPNVESSDISRRRRVPPTASWFKNNSSVDSGLNSDRDYGDRLPRLHKGKPIVPSRKTQDIDSGVSMLTLSQVSVGSGDSSSSSSKAGRGSSNSERRGIPKPEPGPSSSSRRGPTLGAPVVKRHSPPSDGRKLKEYVRL